MTGCAVFGKDGAKLLVGRVFRKYSTISGVLILSR
jgi:hypothetical protein